MKTNSRVLHSHLHEFKIYFVVSHPWPIVLFLDAHTLHVDRLGHRLLVLFYCDCLLNYEDSSGECFNDLYSIHYI